jgi:hypothetical protein
VSPECRFGNAAVSTINTNKKIIAKLQNKETELQMKVSKSKKQEILFGGKETKATELWHEENQFMCVIPAELKLKAQRSQ